MITHRRKQLFDGTKKICSTCNTRIDDKLSKCRICNLNEEISELKVTKLEIDSEIFRSQKELKELVGVMELINQGHSCFINASVQLIDDMQLINEKKISNNPTIQILLDLINNRNTNNELYNLINQEDPIASRQYYIGIQEDAMEFLSKMIQFLEGDYIKTKFNRNNKFSECKDRIPNPDKNELDLYIILDIGVTVVNGIGLNTLKDFIDQLQIKTYIAPTLISNDETRGIEKQKFIAQQRERIEDENNFNYYKKLISDIENEKGLTIGGCVNQQHTLLPYDDTKNLIIQLLRYDHDHDRDFYNEGELKKITHSITPNENLRFGEINFVLTGCIIHEGNTTESGHYTYLSFKNGAPHKYISDTVNFNYEYMMWSDKDKDKYDYLKNGYIYLYTKSLEERT